MIEDPCLTLPRGRRRVFWATQPESCGTYTLCGYPCEIPGLEYEEPPLIAHVIEAAHASDTVTAGVAMSASMVEPATATDSQDRS